MHIRNLKKKKKNHYHTSLEKEISIAIIDSISTGNRETPLGDIADDIFLSYTKVK